MESSRSRTSYFWAAVIALVALVSLMSPLGAIASAQTPPAYDVGLVDPSTGQWHPAQA